MPDLSFPLRTQDWMIDVARGSIMSQTAITIRGVQYSGGTLTTVRGYVGDCATQVITQSFPSAAGQQVRVKSSSANDTIAGTGARKITIDYLTAAFIQKYETINLSGVTGVNSVATDVAYINKIAVIDAGTSKMNEGNITCSNVAETETYQIILVNNGITLLGFYTVPQGKTLYASSIFLSGNSTGGECIVQSNVDSISGSVITAFQTVVHTCANPTPGYSEYNLPFKAPTGGQIRIMGIPQGVSSHLYALIRGFLE
jgi:hypothetical protein